MQVGQFATKNSVFGVHVPVFLHVWAQAGIVTFQGWPCHPPKKSKDGMAVIPLDSLAQGAQFALESPSGLAVAYRREADKGVNSVPHGCCWHNVAMPAVVQVKLGPNTFEFRSSVA